MHAKLWPYVEQIDWIAKNLLEIVHNLNKTIFTEPPLINSIDVVSMYTNIQHSDGIEE
jgi:hypothetical protein